MPNVYLLESGAHYKIGHALKVKDRLADLAVGNPVEIRVVHTLPTSEPRKLEAFFHERWKAKRVRGEWFALSHSDVEFFIRYQIEVLEAQLYEERKTKHALFTTIEKFQLSEADMRARLKKSVPTADKLLLSLDEASTLTGLSTARLRAAIGEGKLVARKVGRAWKMRRGDVEAFVNSIFEADE